MKLLVAAQLMLFLTNCVLSTFNYSGLTTINVTIAIIGGTLFASFI